MSNTVLKVVVLLFFVSGITAFVGYQAGYFDEKKPKSDSEKQENPTNPDQAETSKEPDTSQIAAPEIEPMQPLTKEKAESAEQKRLRMYSSKSVIVEPIELEVDSALFRSKDFRRK